MLVYCVYLYGIERWGPSEHYTEFPAVATHASAVLTGLSRVRSSHRVGWLPWHDADIFVFCRAVRALLEAVQTGGPICFAVIQLVRSAGCHNSRVGSIWFCRLHKRVRIVWSIVNVSIAENIVDIESSEMGVARGIPKDWLSDAFVRKIHK